MSLLRAIFMVCGVACEALVTSLADVLEITVTVRKREWAILER